MCKCKLSVIIPVYNEEKHLEQCLTSLLNQTVKPLQVIVVDDGSTDKSINIIEKYSKIGGFQIIRRRQHKSSDIRRVPYVIRDGSKRLSDFFDYVAVLDADTVLERNYYEKLVEALTEHPRYGIVGGELINQPKTGMILGLFPYVYGCNRVYTRECWMKLNDGKVMKPVPSWDTYHNIYARSFGFNPTRISNAKSWSLRIARTSSPFYKGYVSFQLGYHPLFLFARSLKERRVSMFAGYLKAFCAMEKQYPTKRIVRQHQTNRMKRILRCLL